MMEGVKRTFVSAAEALRLQTTELAHEYRWSRSSRIAANSILGLCLLLITVSVGIDVLRFLDIRWFETRAFSLTRDHAIPEFYGYLMSLTVAISLFLVFQGSRLYSTLFFSLLYGFILLDDALQYHEQAGEAFVGVLNIPGLGGLRASDLGELIAWGLAAIALAPMLLWCLHRRQHADLGVYVLFGLTFVATALFGTAVDAVHALSSSPSLHRVLGWIEDGGELFMLSLAAAFAMLFLRAASRLGSGAETPTRSSS